ncbi:molybdopterin-guanine dinucleotide biosynthesis protein B [Komagataeibacter saccharivorans]|uniref:Molybdopterin-guanine dinucleotide biosynthesis adapter protein n=1 Tax=Komagataeibacter saccharivorans TaxID=265959 RepID=A0A347WF34_9PROT|nr:molybdopterin-guanine dinucleotide biosynthesis protein B [Komagataeibacter saccharivorans]AXY23477.1 Molybdopterin-guanine dinucleotide biosynthesis adapter protein [Komagataeibacter saccharivorans]MBL7237959.1 molybdopterin-guanine dinucleotide biosynthesis protein B [Novacetimonas hansenii]GBQ37591.1 molybdopterin-guanine dinucleotide biosynthesis protein B [Komagataeibacter saccharivorans NRIC 0614]
MSHPALQALIGITGRSGSGKTHLLARLLPVLRAGGLAVSTIKHTHHDIDIDRPGKDSWLHRNAGAGEVMLATPGRWVLQHECPDAPPTLAELLGRMQRTDLVVVEGFHASVPACIEVYRPALGKEPLFMRQDNIIAIATDTPGAPGLPAHLPVLDVNDTAAVARFALEHACSVQLD